MQIAIKEFFDAFPGYTVSITPRPDGKLLLTNHATQLVEGIGRTKGFAPNIFASGTGSDNPDV